MACLAEELQACLEHLRCFQKEVLLERPYKGFFVNLSRCIPLLVRPLQGGMSCVVGSRLAFSEINSFGFLGSLDLQSHHLCLKDARLPVVLEAAGLLANADGLPLRWRRRSRIAAARTWSPKILPRSPQLSLEAKRMNPLSSPMPASWSGKFAAGRSKGRWPISSMIRSSSTERAPGRSSLSLPPE